MAAAIRQGESMQTLKSDSIPNQNVSRRLFLGGIGAASTLLSSRLYAGTEPNNAVHEMPILSGSEFDLLIAESWVNYNGSPRLATTVNGSIPGPTLIWQEGDTVTIRVKNNLKTMTSIHWHGVLLPFAMDGVPGISFSGIKPGETFTYRFRINQTGTYWYHSHAGFQEMKGLFGAIIIKPKNNAANPPKEFVIHLSDWTDANPLSLFSQLKIHSDFNNFIEPTSADFIRDAKHYGLDNALAMRKMWNQMRMSPTDLSDLSSYSLNYLLNGRTSEQGWTGLFKKGETLLLRFINSSSNTFYDVRIPGLKLQIVEADGQDVEPVTVDEFRFGSGETYAALVEPNEDAYTIFAQTMDRTGFAKGTLAVREGLNAPVPAPDIPQWLTMTDMGMGMKPAKMQGKEQGHEMNGMKMDDSAMPMAGMSHEQDSMKLEGKPIRHARDEYGPSVDMRIDKPRTNLDNPGVGLRDNGRKVLTLADLKTLGGSADKRKASQEMEFHLTGNMERYSWSFDGLEFGKSTPVFLPHGERIRITLHNDTMMTHPMHLHGMFSEVLSPEGNFQVRRHTFPVQPGQRITFEVTADAIGRWAWHCHLLFHMDAGMFREVLIA